MVTGISRVARFRRFDGTKYEESMSVPSWEGMNVQGLEDMFGEDIITLSFSYSYDASVPSSSPDNDIYFGETKDPAQNLEPTSAPSLIKSAVHESYSPPPSLVIKPTRSPSVVAPTSPSSEHSITTPLPIQSNDSTKDETQGPSAVPSSMMLRSCHGTDRNEGSESIPIHFFYAAETLTDNVHFIEEIEAEILDITAVLILNCSGDRESGRFLGEGFRRIGGSVNVIGVSSFPPDKESAYTCSATSINANFCYVIEARMRVISSESGSSDSTIKSAVKSIVKESMDKGIMVKSMPNIVSVRFLGNEYNVNRAAPSAPVRAISVPSNDTDTGLPSSSKIYISVGAVVAAMIALVLTRQSRRRGKRPTYQQDTIEDGLVSSFDDTEQQPLPKEDQQFLREYFERSDQEEQEGSGEIHENPPQFGFDRNVCEMENISFGVTEQQTPPKKGQRFLLEDFETSDLEEQEGSGKIHESHPQFGFVHNLCEMESISSNVSNSPLQVEQHSDEFLVSERDNHEDHGANTEIARNTLEVEYNSDASSGSDGFCTRILLFTPYLDSIAECHNEDESGSDGLQYSPSRCGELQQKNFTQSFEIDEASI